MEKENTNISLRKDIKKKATEAIKQGKFTGITSLTGLIELSLEQILNRNCKQEA